MQQIILETVVQDDVLTILVVDVGHGKDVYRTTTSS